MEPNIKQQIELFKNFVKLNGIAAEPIIEVGSVTGDAVADTRLVFTNDQGKEERVSVGLMLDSNSEEYELKTLFLHFGLKDALIQVGWLKFTGQEKQEPRHMYQITDPPVPTSSVGPPVGPHLPGHFRIMHGDPQEGAMLNEGGRSYVCVAFSPFFRCWRLL